MRGASEDDGARRGPGAPLVPLTPRPYGGRGPGAVRPLPAAGPDRLAGPGTGRHTGGTPVSELVRRHTDPFPAVAATGTAPTPARGARRRSPLRRVRTSAFGATTAVVLLAGTTVGVVTVASDGGGPDTPAESAGPVEQTLRIAPDRAPLVPDVPASDVPLVASTLPGPAATSTSAAGTPDPTTGPTAARLGPTGSTGAPARTVDPSPSAGVPGSPTAPRAVAPATSRDAPSSGPTRAPTPTGTATGSDRPTTARPRPTEPGDEPTSTRPSATTPTATSSDPSPTPSDSPSDTPSDTPSGEPDGADPTPGTASADQDPAADQG